MTDHSAYGLAIRSEIDLPELAPAPEPVPAPDLSVVLDAVPRDDAGWTAMGPFAAVAEDGAFRMEVRDVARFHVTGGDRIAVEPAAGADMASVRLFLLGSALGAALMQRGHFLLHGNAVEVDGRCMVCVGPSGIGKSTLAAAFLGRGHRVLSDDVVAVTPEGLALPGVARLKLWRDALERLELDAGALPRVRPTMEKYGLGPGAGYCAEARPIGWVYALRRSNEPGVAIERLRGMEAFMALRDNTYRLRFVDGMGQRPDNLKAAAALAGTARVSRVRRPDAGYEIEALVEALLADMAGGG